MREAVWQAQVEKIARLWGWEPYHTRRSKGSHKGWPDLVLCKPPIILYRELKTDNGKATADQKKWFDLLRACGQDVGVWRPRDFPEVVRVLSGGQAEGR